MKSLIIAKKEILDLTRDRRTLMFMFGFPLLFMPLFFIGGMSYVKQAQEKAVEKNLLSNERASELSEKEIFDLIFEPGFSSAEQVTELSGRGVGMDVVKTSINQMQGSIKVESKVKNIR